MTVDRHGCPGQGTGAQRAVVHAFQSVLQAFDIPPEHLEVGHEDKPERHRLGVLHMRKADCITVRVLFRLGQHDILQTVQQLQDIPDFLLQEQPAVHLALVVAAAGSVQLLAGVADHGNEPAFNAHVDIFILDIERDLAALYTGPDRFQSRDDPVSFVLCDNALFCQHGHMGNTAVNVLAVHLLIKENRCVVILDDFIHIPGESSAPQICHVSTSPFTH